MLSPRRKTGSRRIHISTNHKLETCRKLRFLLHLVGGDESRENYKTFRCTAGERLLLSRGRNRRLHKILQEGLERGLELELGGVRGRREGLMSVEKVEEPSETPTSFLAGVRGWKAEAQGDRTDKSKSRKLSERGGEVDTFSA